MKNIWVDVAQKFSVLSKYELALALNRCQPFDRGDVIYQDADALIRLRNEIVHYQTGFREYSDAEPKRFEQRLKGKFKICAYYAKHLGPLFPHRCLGAGCAVWAAKTAREFADEFHSKLGVGGPYQKLTYIPTLL